MKYIPLGKLLLPILDDITYKQSTFAVNKNSAQWHLVDMEKSLGNDIVKISANLVEPDKGGIAEALKVFPNPEGVVSSGYMTFRGRKAHRQVCIKTGADQKKRYCIQLITEEKGRTYILSCIAPDRVRKPAVQLWERFLKEIKENPTP